MLQMDAKIKAQWIEELRSGKYEQGRGELHRLGQPRWDDEREREGDSFCCLGILSRMCHQAGAVSADDLDGIVMSYGEHFETAYLPVEVVAWAGLEFEGKRMTPDARIEEARGILTNGDPHSGSDQVSLSRMNDSGSTFDEIADTIEKHIVGV